MKVKAWQLEHDFAEAIYGMIDHGVYFDRAKAEKLEQELSMRRAEVFEVCKGIFPGTVEEMKTPAYWSDPEDGVFYATKSKAPSKRRPHLQRGPNKTKTTPFNPSSRPEIIRNLKALGWEPEEFTDAGQPKLNDDVLRALDLGVDLSPLADLFMLDKRLGYLATGDHALLGYCTEDSRIHGWVNHSATNTSRCRHSRPNLSQCPSLRKPYGREFRELFCAPKGHVLVGADAGRLELVIQAHHMDPYDGGAYAKVVSEGDIHETNRTLAGLPTRDSAKVFIYRLNYGSGDAGLVADLDPPETAIDYARKAWEKYGRRVLAELKRPKRERDLGWFWKLRREAWSPIWYVATTIAKGRKPLAVVAGRCAFGASKRSEFMERTPAYAKLAADLKKEARANEMVLRGLDGRKLYPRDEKDAVNTQFQGDGAIVMKLVTTMTKERLRGTRAHLVLHSHDEHQFEVPVSKADKVAETMEECFPEAAERLGVRCPLTGEAKVGETWASTH